MRTGGTSRAACSLGLEVTTGVGKTGVVAVVEPESSPDDAPVVLLRFDMDALPILEMNDVPYASQNAGVMHACGHDGHTAIGMGVAQIVEQAPKHYRFMRQLPFSPPKRDWAGHTPWWRTAS